MGEVSLHMGSRGINRKRTSVVSKAVLSQKRSSGIFAWEIFQNRVEEMVVYMHRLARFLDPRNTIEGKIVSVILSVVLVFSMVNLSTIVENASAAGSDGDALFTTELATDDKAKTQAEGGESSQNQIITDEQADATTPDSNQPDQKNNGVAALSLDDDQNSDESNNTQSAPQQQQQRAAASYAQQAKANTPSISGNKIKNVVAVDQDGKRINKDNLDSNKFTNDTYTAVSKIAPLIDGYSFDKVTYKYEGYLGTYDLTPKELKLKDEKLFVSFWGDKEVDLAKLIFHYSKEVKKYKVFFDGNGVNLTNSSITTSDEQITLPEPSKKSDGNKSFKGWSTNPNATSGLLNPGDKVTITLDTVYYAIWETQQTENALKVIYDLNGANGEIASVNTKEDSWVEITSEVPEREGYVFKGWSIVKEAGTLYEKTPASVIYNTGELVYVSAKDVTLYAQWAPTSSSYGKFKISFLKPIWVF